MAVYKNYIDGKWTAPSTGKYYTKTNPANYEDIIGEYPLSQGKDVDAAIENCSKAFKPWRRTLINDR